MTDPFYGIRLKLDRAEQQTDALDNDITGFRKTEPYGTVVHYYEHYGVLVLYAKVREPPPGMWGVRIGEILHNLRSSLDHLVWELVKLETGKEPVTKKTQFPVFEFEKGYNDRGDPDFLHGVGASAKALIKSLQPFSSGQGGTSSLLWQLQELNNFDKHRTIHVTGALADRIELHFPPAKPGVSIVGEKWTADGPFVDGAELAKFKLSETGNVFLVPEDQMQVKAPLKVDIAFDQGSPVAAREAVIPTLTRMRTKVRGTIERVAADIFKITL